MVATAPPRGLPRLGGRQTLSAAFGILQVTFFRHALLLACLGGILFNSTGCTTAIVAGAAAAGGYVAHQKGYRVRNPITRNASQDGGDADGK